MTTTMTLTDLAATSLSAIRILEHHGLDYCCASYKSRERTKHETSCLLADLLRGRHRAERARSGCHRMEVRRSSGVGAASNTSSTINTWAVFRFALAYPDERHLERFADLCETVPGTLAELRSLYIDLFEAGLPQPRCPLLESAWLLNRPAGDVVLENKPYYQNFGLEIDGRAAPDHLLTQLEFLAWLDHCEAAGNTDLESVHRARAEFLERHLSHWVGSLAHLSENSGGGCYAELLEALAREVESALS